MTEFESQAFKEGVGQRIQTARKARGMSPKALYTEIGYTSHTMLLEIEKGVQLPSYEKLMAIALVLGVSVDWILGIERRTGTGIDLETLARKEALLECYLEQLRAVTDGIKSLCPLPS